MSYRKTLLMLIAFVLLTLQHTKVQAQSIQEVSMNKVKLSFKLDKGEPFYTVSFDDRPVILQSRLGLQLKNEPSFNSTFVLMGTSEQTVDTTWKPVWGQVSEIRNHYHQLTVHLKGKGKPNRLLDIVFRVFKDGVGFRYVFPKQDELKYFIVSDELTQFHIAGNYKAFWIPGDYDTNEYTYTTSHLSEIDNRQIVNNSTDIAVRVAPGPYAVQTPLMLESKDSLYVNIHEAALVNYPAMELHVNGNNNMLSARLVPDAVGNKAYLHAPDVTPWRTVIVSDKATDILASKMILNLNEPSKVKDTSWIHPMKFVGVWWEMQTGKSTWCYSNYPDSVSASGQLIPNGRHGANTQNVKRYIDFAANNGIRGVLIEGWNTGWEDWFGNWKENVFDFVTPYPDFDIKEVSSYAASKGVQLIMHNETSGSATNYERHMDDAFQLMRKYGYKAVKTGYVGKIIPRGEHHDGQWMVNHYLRVAKKAAHSHILLDSHESVRPTGLQRTWPNWMASEAARGNEYNAFSHGSPPEHETILPFTRLMGGPMDYTPGIFKLKGYAGGAPDRQMHSTLAKQLALYVTIYSPLQMVADLPKNYEAHMDAFQFIKDVPVDWDDTKIIEAEPGDYVTIARKDKESPAWFIGSVTDENSRNANISLHFLNKKTTYITTIYADASDANWKSNPGAYSIKKYLVNAQTQLKPWLAPGGGYAASIKPASKLQIKNTDWYK